MGSRYVTRYGNSVLSVQFHYETKTTLKDEGFFFFFKGQKVWCRWTDLKEKCINCCTENWYYEEVELRKQASWECLNLLKNGQQKGSIYSCPATSPHMHHGHFRVTSTSSVPTIVRIHFLKILFILEWEHKHVCEWGEGQGKGKERESGAGSLLTTEPRHIKQLNSRSNYSNTSVYLRQILMPALGYTSGSSEYYFFYCIFIRL